MQNANDIKARFFIAVFMIHYLTKTQKVWVAWIDIGRHDLNFRFKNVKQIQGAYF